MSDSNTDRDSSCYSDDKCLTNNDLDLNVELCYRCSLLFDPINKTYIVTFYESYYYFWDTEKIKTFKRIEEAIKYINKDWLNKPVDIINKKDFSYSDTVKLSNISANDIRQGPSKCTDQLDK